MKDPHKAPLWKSTKETLIKIQYTLFGGLLRDPHKAPLIKSTKETPALLKTKSKLFILSLLRFHFLLIYSW